MNNKIPTLLDVIYDLLSKGVLIPNRWVNANKREFIINPDLKPFRVTHRGIPMNPDVTITLEIIQEDIVAIELSIGLEVYTSLLGEIRTKIELYYDGYDWSLLSYYDETKSVREPRSIYSREGLSIIKIEDEKPIKTNIREEDIEYFEGVMEEALYILSVLNS